MKKTGSAYECQSTTYLNESHGIGQNRPLLSNDRNISPLHQGRPNNRHRYHLPSRKAPVSRCKKLNNKVEAVPVIRWQHIASGVHQCVIHFRTSSPANIFRMLLLYPRYYISFSFIDLTTCWSILIMIWVQVIIIYTKQQCLRLSCMTTSCSMTVTSPEKSRSPTASSSRLENVVYESNLIIPHAQQR